MTVDASFSSDAQPMAVAGAGSGRSLANEVRRTHLSYIFVKRTLDLVLGTVLLILVTPLLACAALAISVTSPGPVFFRQQRVGRGGKLFMMWKLRTMYTDNDDSVHREYVRSMFGSDRNVSCQCSGLHKLDDDRVTPVGGLLRRTSIDELPQLFNVIRGGMSLIGPRPALPWEVELFADLGRVRSMVKPGITGLWQVSGRSQLTMCEALELDCVYAQRQSLLLDLKILVKTIPIVLAGRGAA
jgi:lipopolysaccharide/colanic/teichoic acid biosynthesis glycosyltransferase